jgi:DNA-binding GntR family transcriptional regulator
MSSQDPFAVLSPVSTLSRSGRAYDALEEAIVHCRLAPGLVLSDRQVSESLGISRTPVREAFQNLEASGLVIRRGGRYMVAEFDVNDARELFELRRYLEPPGLDRLAETWDEDIVRELSTFFEGLPAHLPDGPHDEYLKRDHQFHKMIVQLSENSRLVRFYEIIERQIHRIRHYLAPGYRGRMEQVTEEHQHICAAIGRRDLPAAREALLRHLHAGVHAMITFLAEKQIGS